MTQDRLRVLGLMPYPRTNAGVRLRFEQQLGELAKQRVDVVLSPFLDVSGYRVAFEPGHVVGKILAVARGFARRMRDAARVRRFDLVLVYRESTPFGPRLVESAAVTSRVPILFDLDEALFVPTIHPANKRWAWLRDPQRVGRSCRSARLVTTQNEYLAEFVRRFNDHVAVVPTPVDTEARRPRAWRPPGPIVIGWLGSPTTAPYLHEIDDALASISAEFEVVIRVVGGQYINRRIPRLDVREFALDQEQFELDGFDIGILPEPDDPWTRGKGGYKALLYMAAGLPVVASRVGVNPDIVVDGETGFCVSTTDEWLKALRRLIQDESLRSRFGRAGRERVVQRYSIPVTAARFATAMHSATLDQP